MDSFHVATFRVKIQNILVQSKVTFLQRVGSILSRIRTKITVEYDTDVTNVTAFFKERRATLGTKLISCGKFLFMQGTN